jgi:hypothetical protein
VKGNKTPASHKAMPIPIIIAILIALFTLGANMDKKKAMRPEVVILGGKQVNWVDKNDNGDNLVVMAPEKEDHSITIKGQRQTGNFENIFEFLFFYQIIKAEPIAANNSINQ